MCPVASRRRAHAGVAVEARRARKRCTAETVDTGMRRALAAVQVGTLGTGRSRFLAGAWIGEDITVLSGRARSRAAANSVDTRTRFTLGSDDTSHAIFLLWRRLRAQHLDCAVGVSGDHDVGYSVTGDVGGNDTTGTETDDDLGTEVEAPVAAAGIGIDEAGVLKESARSVIVSLSKSPALMSCGVQTI